MTPANKKAFNLFGNHKNEVSTENDALKNKIHDYDEKWIKKTQAKLLKQIGDDKRANLIKSRMEKHLNKQ